MSRLDKTNTEFYIVYDGIGSSVFHGQVFLPTQKRLQKNPEINVYIISYEYARDIKKAQNLIATQFSSTPNLHLVISPKYPFIGSINNWNSARHLKKVIYAVARKEPYIVRARGPFAGAISLHAADKNLCQKIIIQARGLVAAEYRYEYEQEQTRTKNKLKKTPATLMRSIVNYLRSWQFERLERNTYQLKNAFCGPNSSADNRDNSGKTLNTIDIKIEAVSDALKNYVIKTWHAPADKIIIATEDKPETISLAQRATWSQEVRAELAIPKNAYVYCYSGSIKPWQCPDLTIQFFAQQREKKANCYLLILTQDKSAFKKLLDTNAIPTDQYRIITVPHNSVYHYLAACDTGILFRQHHIINWVSRPTKALEYHAAGLNIAHNNTIAYLCRAS